MEYFENFISYRRQNMEWIAEKLYETLSSHGCSVFWDQKTLKAGDFSEDIEKAICHCKNFILVVNQESLERCVDKEDWIRKEILLAFEGRKNIVTLFVKENFQFPENFPEELSRLKKINGIPFFDIDNQKHVEDLIVKFLKYDRSISSRDDFQIEGDTLIKYIGSAPYVEIPEKITIIAEGAFSDNTFIVDVKLSSDICEIQEAAFERCRNIKVLEFPPQLKCIGKRAFRRCVELNMVKLNEGLETIEEEAFGYCSKLTGLEIPASVKEIHNTAFNNCSSLSKMEVSKDNVFYRSEAGILYDEKGSRVIRCPEAKGSVELPDIVTDIGEYAFYKCNISNLKISGSLDFIGTYAFKQAKIEDLDYHGEMPSKVGEFAFVGSKFLNGNPFQQKEDKSGGTNRKIKQQLMLFEYVIVTTTFESCLEAHNMVTMLLDEKLIVAGQIREITSIYSWNNEICDEKEYEVVCITEGRLYEEVETFIKANHSYDLCQICCMPIINTSVEYGSWISDYVKNAEVGNE